MRNPSAGTGGPGTCPPIVILAGGKGTRLQSVESVRPKPMVLVREKPFLHWLVAHYARLGCTRVIFSVGHKAEFIENHDWKADFKDITFEFAREDTPLGTGGAVLEIFRSHDLSDAWVINGDTLLPQPLPDLRSLRLEALYLALAPGNIFDAEPNLVVEGDRVRDVAAGGAYFDAGAVYVTRRAVERGARPAPYSLHVLLTPAMQAGQVGYQVVPGTCFDIGTPGRLERFAAYLSSL